MTASASAVTISALMTGIAVEDRLHALFAGEHTDRAHRTEHRGEHGGEEGEQEGIPDHTEHLAVRKEGPVVGEREALELSDHVRLIETVDRKQQNGEIEDEEDESDKECLEALVAQRMFVHSEVPLTFSSDLKPPESQVERNTTTSSTRAIIDPMCQSLPK